MSRAPARAGGAQAELGELLEVGKGKLREIGELLDRGFVGGGELIDLQHVRVLVGSGGAAALCCTAQEQMLRRPIAKSMGLANCLVHCTIELGGPRSPCGSST